MPNFGVISNNQIINVIVADTKEVAESVSKNECILIDGTFIGAGHILNQETNEWFDPRLVALDAEDDL